MELNWVVVTYFVIGFFALAGYSRGWWKEALTGSFLVVLVFLVQIPSAAQGIINLFNAILDIVWGFIPTSIASIITNGFNTIFQVNIAGRPLQANASDPGTWLLILTIGLAIFIMFGRFSFNNVPTRQGGLLGLLIGGNNGFLTLSLIREYLDGRSLPGNNLEIAGTQLTLVGGSSFGPASPSIAIQATGLPQATIFDSIIPWIMVGIGLIFLFSVLKTRVSVDGDKNKGKKVNVSKLPPFYKVVSKKSSPPTAEDILNIMLK